MSVAVVTGAGSGIGRGVAQGLLSAGWQVALAGRTASKLEETAAGADGTLVVPADVTDEAAVEHLFEQVTDTFGRVDLLFNNAGVYGASKPFEELELGELRGVLETNLIGAFLCARAAVRAMKAQSPQGGRIINNGSIAAQRPRVNGFAYAAAKHAVTGLTKSIALEGREYDIACGQIDIGNAATEMVAGFSEATMDVGAAVRGVLYMAELPLDATVLSLTVLATKMPFVGRA